MVLPSAAFARDLPEAGFGRAWAGRISPRWRLLVQVILPPTGLTLRQIRIHMGVSRYLFWGPSRPSINRNRAGQFAIWDFEGRSVVQNRAINRPRCKFQFPKERILCGGVVRFSLFYAILPTHQRERAQILWRRRGLLQYDRRSADRRTWCSMIADKTDMPFPWSRRALWNHEGTSARRVSPLPALS